MREKEFDVTIVPVGKDRGVDISELWNYRDLIILLVRRDFVANYKQTILGPAWAIIQPVMSTLITALVFGNLAGMSPAGIPVFLFYMSGQVLWTFFSSCLNATVNTFLDNVNVMGKVYFPRFIPPIASTVSKLVSLSIQVVMFCGFYAWYVLRGNYTLSVNWTLILVPLYIIHLIILALGVGSILSSLTTKYRDLKVLITYGITFWMYLSPVVYDVTTIPQQYQSLFMLNPVAPVLTHIRYALFSQGDLYWSQYGISCVVSIILLMIGYRIFNYVARTFVDTI